MLACARIGAAAQRRVRRLLVAGAGRPHQRRRGQGADHRRRRLAARRGVPAQAGRRRGRRQHDDDRARRRRQARRQRRRDGRRAATSGTTTSWPSRRPTARPSRSTPSTCCSCSTRRARPASPRASCTRPAATSTQVAFTHKYVFDLHPDTDVYWCTADVGWVTGHSYIVYGPLANGATVVMYEGVPELPGQRPLLGDRREVQGHDLLHRPDGDPHDDEVGPRGAREARPVEPARPRIGRRADQPRGVDVVPPVHRRRALPDRRHVVADRDRRRS